MIHILYISYLNIVIELSNMKKHLLSKISFKRSNNRSATSPSIKETIEKSNNQYKEHSSYIMMKIGQQNGYNDNKLVVNL